MTVLALRPEAAPASEPALVPASPANPMSQIPDLSRYPEFYGRRRFSREDCDFLERVGFLTERYELLDGEIVLKVGQHLPHGTSVMRALLWLANIFPNDRVQTQVTVEVAIGDQPLNRPEPDIFVLREPASAYGARPEGSDLLLAIEVADTTLRSDLTVKASLYARAGVPEYWVMDVNSRKIFVHQAPEEGVYQYVTVSTDVDVIAALAAPDRTIAVTNLFPPIAQAKQ